jgi:hypothetical protein
MDARTNWPLYAIQQEQRRTDRLDAAGRLDARIICQAAHYRRAVGIAWEAARLVRLPSRDAPRTYYRKGVRYLAWAQDGMIWVQQEVDE